MNAARRVVITLIFSFIFLAGTSLAIDLPTSIPPSGRFQDFQSPLVCAECHPRQFREFRQAVHAGFRNVSPTFNALELAGNALAQAGLDAGRLNTNVTDPTVINNNLRPVYADTPRQG